MLEKSNIINALDGLKDPLLGKSYSELGWARMVGDNCRIRLGYPHAPDQITAIQRQGQQMLRERGIDCKLEISAKIARHQVQQGTKPQMGIKNVVAVGSGKGGVGKSTLAANLALALCKLGAKVGILDADIYGPSQPAIFGVKQKPKVVDNKFIPLNVCDISLLSMGLLVEDQQAMIWRGPMVSGALMQMFNDAAWPDLDYLILDLPPGTGDIQLTMAQKLPIAGAVVVTTPQDLSLLDANKAISMFEKVNIPVLGLVENMSTFICPSCGHQEPLFGQDGGEHVAKTRQVPLLGSIPLARQISKDTDQGLPSVASGDSQYAQSFVKVAQSMAAQLALRPTEYQLSIQTKQST